MHGQAAHDNLEIYHRLAEPQSGTATFSDLFAYSDTLTFLCRQIRRAARVLILHKQMDDVQVLHMQIQGDPNPTEGQELQLGWMALCPELRYMLAAV